MRTLLFFAILCSCAPLGAHDFWIEPSTYRPTSEVVRTELRVGENFAGEPVPRRSARIVSFIVRDANGERPVPGLENRRPAGLLRVAGAAVIGYQSKVHEHEGHRERFQRFAKTLIGNHDEILGFRYELVREGDGVRVWFEGKALANAEVVAMSRGGKRCAVRSDRDGRVALPLTKGVWLITSVHYVGSDSLWASLTLEV